jgi:putative transposase
VAAPTGVRSCRGRCGAAEADPDDPCWITRDLWRAAGACRAPGRRGEAWAQTHCPANARRRVDWRQPPARLDRYHTARQGSQTGTRLGDRDFTALRPNQLWVADITFVPTASGFLYLAVVLDAWSRKIIGWSMANYLRTELVLDALEMAIDQRRPDGVIHHSDQGSQYTSLAFGKRCKEAGVRPSMGSVGDAYDNAMCESFFATLECELLERRRFTSKIEAKMACFSFIEGWYNPVRLHSALGYRSPMAYEAAMEAVTTEP